VWGPKEEKETEENTVKSLQGEGMNRKNKVIVRYHFNELNTDFNKTLHSEGIGRRITSFCLGLCFRWTLAGKSVFRSIWELFNKTILIV
jgi:hypothetical protein